MKYPIPEAALTQHIAVLGKTGSGKTSTAKLAIEQVVAQGARVCVLDPIKSDWWGLISSADGKHAGLPFHILGGPRGHVPLHASAGKAIAEVVASGALPLSILDMTDFEPGGHAQFFIQFIPTLLRRMRGVVYLVIEEAHLFAPKERSGIGAENMAIHWAKTLATAHRLTAPADQEPVLKWLKANTEPEVRDQVAKSLSSLRTGTGWICSGEAKVFQQVEFPRIKTYDNTATPTGDGEDHAVKTATVDTEKLRAIVGDAVKEAEASDPKLLRAEIAKLKREIVNLGTAIKVDNGPTPEWRAEYEEAHARDTEAAYLRGRSEALTGVVKVLKDTREHLTAAVSNVDAIYHETGMAQLKAMPRRSTDIQKKAEKYSESGPRRVNILKKPSGDSSADLGNTGLRRMLIALAQRPQGMNKRQLGVRAGLSSSSGTFSTYLGKGRSEGWMNGDAGTIRITDRGIAALGQYEPLPTGQELLAYWLGELGNSGAARLLQAVADAYPKGLSRDVAAERADLSPGSGTFSTYLGKLRTLELITGSGELRASDDLFD